MKIFEIVNESMHGRMRRMHKQALPNLSQFDQLDNSKNPYYSYRFGIALAVGPNQHMDLESPMGSDFVTIDYSDADAEIRRGAERIMRVKPSHRTGKGSKELDSVQKVSPVNRPRPNKYGV